MTAVGPAQNAEEHLGLAPLAPIHVTAQLAHFYITTLLPVLFIHVFESVKLGMFGTFPRRILMRKVETHPMQLSCDGVLVVTSCAFKMIFSAGQGVALHAVTMEESPTARNPDPLEVLQLLRNLLVTYDAISVRG